MVRPPALPTVPPPTVDNEALFQRRLEAIHAHLAAITDPWLSELTGVEEPES